jgi:hypothetical protein
MRLRSLRTSFFFGVWDYNFIFDEKVKDQKKGRIKKREGSKKGGVKGERSSPYR